MFSVHVHLQRTQLMVKMAITPLAEGESEVIRAQNYYTPNGCARQYLLKFHHHSSNHVRALGYQGERT